MINIPLNETPNELWEKEYNDITSDSFIQRKYNRERRLQNKYDYIRRWTPEIMIGGGFVIDIGPGPGEYLELCRYFGNKIQGFDAKIDLSMMGNNYTRVCQLISQRQNIPIIFDDFMRIISEDFPIEKSSVSMINSQGAIEQIFKRFMYFPEGTNDEGWIPSHNGYWIPSEECQEAYNIMFDRFNKWLRPGGKIVFYPNGSKNNDIFDKLLITAISTVDNITLLDNTDDSKRIKIMRKD